MIDSGFDIDWDNEATEKRPLICGRCYEDVDSLHEPLCKEKPETRISPIGMYHCPDCGAMVLASVCHPLVCLRCRDMKHPFFDL